jgi:hypothetical protein
VDNKEDGLDETYGGGSAPDLHGIPFFIPFPDQGEFLSRQWNYALRHPNYDIVSFRLLNLSMRVGVKRFTTPRRGRVIIF